MKNIKLLILGVAALASCTQGTTQRLTEEATPFLERRPAPTGRVVEVELVASPTSLELIDGRTLEVWAYNEQVPDRPSEPAREIPSASAFKTSSPSPPPSTGTGSASPMRWTASPA